MYYYIKTYGCQANKAESERQAGYYESLGLQATNNWKQADRIFINTCSVRKAADDRTWSLLTRMQEYFGALPKKQCPEIILAGCMNRYRERLLKRFPILTRVQEVGETNFAYAPLRRDPTQAFVQISYGCNSFCTYCVVPYARGRERSRDLETIVSEVKQAVKDDYHEITLLGQNVNSWGLEKVTIGQRKLEFAGLDELPSNVSQYHQFDGVPPFVKLLQAVSQVPGVEKIRFLTSNPWDFTDELVNEIARNEKIDRYLHLPVQSGSDEVLRRMNRGYTAADYFNLITKLRQQIPEIQIGTDILGGFPGETEAVFQQTVALVKKANFIESLVAMYSQRPGTVAAKIFRDDVPVAEKKRRFEILDEMINRRQMAKRPKIV
ncbi:MiaB/RimO family radical SAM methylthiotransferase [bacterium]|nr:MiaB/RimO family radical SAM methylthiotransferase [bacterium]